MTEILNCGIIISETRKQHQTRKGEQKMTVNTSKGKITANKDTLNIISIAFLDAAKRYKYEGANALAKSYDRVSEEIYNALKNTGFYDKYHQS